MENGGLLMIELLYDSELRIYFVLAGLYTALFLPPAIKMFFSERHFESNLTEYFLNCMAFLVMFFIVPTLLLLGLIINFFSLEETV